MFKLKIWKINKKIIKDQLNYFENLAFLIIII